MGHERKGRARQDHHIPVWKQERIRWWPAQQLLRALVCGRCCFWTLLNSEEEGTSTRAASR
jgi:hypothetical protein